jgi:hypothetical protein
VKGSDVHCNPQSNTNETCRRYNYEARREIKIGFLRIFEQKAGKEAKRTKIGL